MASSQYTTKTWRSHTLHPKTQDASTVDWIFLVDLLNFSFWSSRGRVYTVTYKNVSYQGYWTLCACMNRGIYLKIHRLALDEGLPITSPAFYSKITLAQAGRIFRPDDTGMNPIPLLEERIRVMQKAGSILVNVVVYYNLTRKEVSRILCKLYQSMSRIGPNIGSYVNKGF